MRGDGVEREDHRRRAHARRRGRGRSNEDVDGVGLLAGDDYRAMYEVLARRFRRGLKRQEERAAAASRGGCEPIRLRAAATTLATRDSS